MSALVWPKIARAEVDHLFKAEDSSRRARRCLIGREADAKGAALELIDNAIGQLVAARKAIAEAS